MFEFSKLDSIDLCVASWLRYNCPRTLYSYLEFIAENDYRRKGTKLNVKKIYDELLEVYSGSPVRERNHLWEPIIFNYNR